MSTYVVIFSLPFNRPGRIEGKINPKPIQVPVHASLEEFVEALKNEAKLANQNEGIKNDRIMLLPLQKVSDGPNKYEPLWGIPSMNKYGLSMRSVWNLGEAEHDQLAVLKCRHVEIPEIHHNIAIAMGWGNSNQWILFFYIPLDPTCHTAA